MQSIEPGISRFRVRIFDAPRNDGGKRRVYVTTYAVLLAGALAGGFVGGLAGLSGPLPTLWASIRGWTKDQRRGVFQIFNGSVLSAALILQAATGFVKLNVFLLAMLAMPGTLIGARLGMRTYHALNDRNFYDVVLALLFLSGAGLVWSSIAPR